MVTRNRKRLSFCAAVMFALQLGACGHTGKQAQSSEVGSVAFSFSPAPDVPLAALTYTITGAHGYIKKGVVPASAIGPTVMPMLTLVPVAKGYVIKLTAPERDGDTKCQGTATFDIAKGSQTNVPLKLECVAAPRPSLSCHECELLQHKTNRDCPDSLKRCEDMQGTTAAQSPVQPRASKSALCKQILACMHANHCAKDHATDCLCGTNADPNVCFAGTYQAMTGACKELIAAGGESTSMAELALRFTDPVFALGAAYSVIETCDQAFCATECL
jgi:hypothetical protein